VLLAVAIATVVALRRTLKRSFLPVLALMIVGWIVSESGFFEQITTRYAVRGMEETGRFLVWPLAIERFLSSPLVGVGLSNVATYVPLKQKPITPHNSFLFIALASGIIPLAFFVAYWWRAARDAFRAGAARAADAPFCIPLLTYALLIALQLNAPFMFPWMAVTLSAAMAADAPRRVRRVIVRQIGRSKVTGHLGRWGTAGPALARRQLRSRPPRF